MNLNKQTIAGVESLAGKRVLIRVDFNVPQDKKTGAITNTQRIVGAMPTIEMALARGGAPEIEALEGTGVVITVATGAEIAAAEIGGSGTAPRAGTGAAVVAEAVAETVPETNAKIPNTRATMPDKSPALANEISSSLVIVNIIGPTAFQITARITAPR